MKIISDIKIAQSTKLKNIKSIAKSAGLNDADIELYGNSKCKISTYDLLIKNNKSKINSTPLVLVTAINPTPAGEGKTTTTIGLSDALSRLKRRVIVALREPSLGPVFGVKGGACGGGYSQVVPMEDINLHFTGDFHAIGAANNLISAMIDNHIFQGNELSIDKENITWHRCVDMNDRQLRFVTVGEGGPKNGITRKDSFDITVASEIMAVFCLAKDMNDLKDRLGKIIIAYNKKGEPVTVSDIKATGAVLVLLKDAFKPNLVQTLEGTPAIIHGGPFANIAHGCNSVVATKTALALGDIVVTEAGFGADLGAEKFLDIKCRIAGLKPSCVVVVATIRALKHHGYYVLEKDNVNLAKYRKEDGKYDLNVKNVEALKKGLPNLYRHVKNLKNVFGIDSVVAINSFPTDTKEEIEFLFEECKKENINVEISEVWAKGGKGGINLAKQVLNVVEKNKNKKLKFTYDLKDSISDKLFKLATSIYHADKVELSDEAKKKIVKFEKMGYNNIPICMAKTQYSFSDNPKLLSAPTNFNLYIKDIKISAGAGFLVAYAGDIMTMPGLPKVPSAEKIFLNNKGNIEGLF